MSRALPPIQSQAPQSGSASAAPALPSKFRPQPAGPPPLPEKQYAPSTDTAPPARPANQDAASLAAKPYKLGLVDVPAKTTAEPVSIRQPQPRHMSSAASIMHPSGHAASPAPALSSVNTPDRCASAGSATMPRTSSLGRLSGSFGGSTGPTPLPGPKPAELAAMQLASEATSSQSRSSPKLPPKDPKYYDKLAAGASNSTLCVL